MSARKYFVYELKKALFAICSLALILTVITVTAILTHYFDNDAWSLGGFGRAESGVETLAFLSGILAAVVPIWMFSYKMKKRSVDLYYALPLKRGQVLRVKYLLGLFAVYAPYTAAFFLSMLAAVIRFPTGAIAGEYYFAAYFASIPAIFCIYSISCFAFTRAQRMIDGIAFVIFWMFALLAVTGAIGRLVDDLFAYMYTPYAPLSEAAGYFASRIELPDVKADALSDAYSVNLAIGFPLTALQTVAASVLLFATERHAKAENIGGVSDSPFGYKVMIPLLTVCIFVCADMLQNTYVIFLLMIVASAAFMLTALYKHSFKIGKVQAIIFAGSILLGIVLSIAVSVAASAINGYNLI